MKQFIETVYQVKSINTSAAHYWRQTVFKLSNFFSYVWKRIDLTVCYKTQKEKIIKNVI